MGDARAGSQARTCATSFRRAPLAAAFATNSSGAGRQRQPRGIELVNQAFGVVGLEGEQCACARRPGARRPGARDAVVKYAAISCPEVAPQPPGRRRKLACWGREGRFAGSRPDRATTRRGLGVGAAGPDTW